jgi:hypothetical protein
MARPWRADDFDSVYNEFVCQDAIKFGTRAYYRRYRSRYKACIERFCSIAPPHPIDILDVGGGQLALVCKKLWNDRAVLADLPGPHTSYLAGHGVETVHWNLCKPEQPFEQVFDAVFFSEVIELITRSHRLEPCGKPSNGRFYLTASNLNCYRVHENPRRGDPWGMWVRSLCV